MGVDRRDVEALIKQHGGRLVRSKRHFVYKFPDGRCFTLACSPSDVNAELHNMAKLRRFLGIEREINKNPDRKRKPGVNGKPAFTETATGVTLRDWKKDLNLQARKLNLFRPKVKCVGYLQRVSMTPLTAILAHLLWK
jgi:hypothetical protein